MYCKICGDEILEAPTLFAGLTVHGDCAEEAERVETALDYARAYPTDFFEYMEELLICTDNEGLTQAAKALLKDFRDNWGGRKPFKDWIADN